eukprot:358413-Chlamydomonas_euryale.AAC.3
MNFSPEADPQDAFALLLPGLNLDDAAVLVRRQHHDGQPKCICASIFGSSAEAVSFAAPPPPPGWLDGCGS